jgi:hypothetical protein
MMEWGAYRAYVPKVQGELRHVSRRDAMEEFEHAMASKESRIAALGALLAENEIRIGESNEDLDVIDTWFGKCVEGNPKSGPPMRLRNVWYAVAYDIGLFLGDLVIKRSPGLEWRAYLPKSKTMKASLSFQNPVVQGFKRVSSPEYFIDPFIMVGSYGGALVNGLADSPDGTLRRIVVAATDVA